MQRLLPFAIVSLLLVTLPSTAMASLGDCGQPASTGDKIRSSDALAVLKSAVGIQPCGLCVCDVDGSGAVRASDALATLKFAVGVEGVNLTCDVCSGDGVTGRVLGLNGTLDDAIAARGVNAGVPFEGFTPVAGALVELHRIDAIGNSLELLDLEETDESGTFSFRASTGLGTDLQLRAFNSGGGRVLSALATAEETDIDPASEFVLAVVLGKAPLGASGVATSVPRGVGGIGLTDFTAGEYNGCVGQARAVTPENAPPDARSFVDLISAATGGLLASQITAFADSPDLTDILNGTYWAISSDVFFEANFTPGTIDVNPDLNQRCIFVGGGIHRVIFDGVGGMGFGGCEFSSFGMCETSGTQRFSGMTDVKINATVDVFRDDEVCEVETGGTYDLAGDGTVVIVAPEGDVLPTIATPDGSYLAVSIIENDDGFARGQAIAFPQATSASNAIFDGEYHLIDTEEFVFRGEQENLVLRGVGFFAGLGGAVSDGDGGVTIDFGAGADIVLTEAAPPAENPPGDPSVTLGVEATDEEGPEDFSYQIDTDGAFTLTAPGESATGAISPDGTLVAFNSTFADESDSGVATQYLVKKAVSMSTSGLAGTYQMVGQLIDVEAEFTPGSFDGPVDVNFRAVCQSAVLGSVDLGLDTNFDIPSFVVNEVCLDEASFVENSTNQPAGRIFDANVSFFTVTENDDSLAGSWNVTPDGKLTLNVEGIELSGAASPDGSFFILQGVTSEAGTDATRVVMIGIRQAE
ncbi:MAG: hypothetical protein ACI8TX_000106 [Hyphomicrobiaceae bacterium]|jgi:hypothetical protein